MKKYLILTGLFFVATASFGAESKVICYGNIVSVHEISSGSIGNGVNYQIASAAKDGFTIVSAPSVAYGPQSNMHDEYGQMVYASVCVTVTKP